MAKIHDVRDEYTKDSLTISNVEKSPFLQFDKWLKVAQDKDLIHWNAMTISTVDKDGIPSSRTVLLKESSESGFIFFTNYNSKKGQDISINNNVSLLFYWRELERQIKVTGKIEKISRQDSQKYFSSRPRGSQIGAIISNQSGQVENREALENKYNQFEKEHEGKDLECPDYWGGYIIKPSKIEFWQGRANRLHDRIQYLKSDNDTNWSIIRVAP